MQLALSGPTRHEFWSVPAIPTPAAKKLALAGVALVGASVIAVNPIAPSLPIIGIEQRAVELHAWEDPFAIWQSTFATASEHISYGLNAIGTETVPALIRILENSPEMLWQLGEGLFSADNWAKFNADLPGYAETLDTGMKGAQEGFQAQLDLLPGVLDTVSTHLSNLQFTEAFKEFNWWFLFTVGGAGWPLFDSLEIPGDIAETFGATKLASVLDGLLTNNAAGNYTQALLAPFITATFQFTEVLDSIVANVKANDWESVLSDVINLPGKVVNALLNGYTPSFATYAWPGLLTKDGLFESLLFKIPNAIGWGISQDSTTEDSTASTLSTVASTAVASSSDLLTVSTDTSTAAKSDATATAATATTETVTSPEVTEAAATTTEAAPTAEDETTSEATASAATPAEAATTETESPTAEASSTKDADEATTTSDDDADSASSSSSTASTESKTESDSDDSASDAKSATKSDTSSDAKSNSASSASSATDSSSSSSSSSSSAKSGASDSSSKSGSGE